MEDSRNLRKMTLSPELQAIMNRRRQYDGSGLSGDTVSEYSASGKDVKSRSQLSKDDSRFDKSTSNLSHVTATTTSIASSDSGNEANVDNEATSSDSKSIIHLDLVVQDQKKRGEVEEMEVEEITVEESELEVDEAEFEFEEESEFEFEETVEEESEYEEFEIEETDEELIDEDIDVKTKDIEDGADIDPDAKDLVRPVKRRGDNTGDLERSGGRYNKDQGNEVSGGGDRARERKNNTSNNKNKSRSRSRSKAKSRARSKSRNANRGRNRSKSKSRRQTRSKSKNRNKSEKGVQIKEEHTSEVDTDASMWDSTDNRSEEELMNEFDTERYSWEKPDWVIICPLKPSQKGDVIRKGVNLAKPITFPPEQETKHLHKEASQSILQPSKTGDVIRKGVNLAKPITFPPEEETKHVHKEASQSILQHSDRGLRMKAGKNLAENVTGVSIERNGSDFDETSSENKNIAWEKPSWTNPVLRSSKNGLGVKDGKKLERAITHINAKKDDEIDEQIGWEKPDWALGSVLKKTKMGKILKKRGNLARPITYKKKVILKNDKLSNELSQDGSHENKELTVEELKDGKSDTEKTADVILKNEESGDGNAFQKPEGEPENSKKEDNEAEAFEDKAEALKKSTTIEPKVDVEVKEIKQTKLTNGKLRIGTPKEETPEDAKDEISEDEKILHAEKAKIQGSEKSTPMEQEVGGKALMEEQPKAKYQKIVGRSSKKEENIACKAKGMPQPSPMTGEPNNVGDEPKIATADPSVPGPTQAITVGLSAQNDRKMSVKDLKKMYAQQLASKKDDKSRENTFKNEATKDETHNDEALEHQNSNDQKPREKGLKCEEQLKEEEPQDDKSNYESPEIVDTTTTVPEDERTKEKSKADIEETEAEISENTTVTELVMPERQPTGEEPGVEKRKIEDPDTELVQGVKQEIVKDENSEGKEYPIRKNERKMSVKELKNLFAVQHCTGDKDGEPKSEVPKYQKKSNVEDEACEKAKDNESQQDEKPNCGSPPEIVVDAAIEPSTNEKTVEKETVEKETEPKEAAEAEVSEQSIAATEQNKREKGLLLEDEHSDDAEVKELKCGKPEEDNVDSGKISIVKKVTFKDDQDNEQSQDDKPKDDQTEVGKSASEEPKGSEGGEQQLDTEGESILHLFEALGSNNDEEPDGEKQPTATPDSMAESPALDPSSTEEMIDSSSLTNEHCWV